MWLFLALESPCMEVGLVGAVQQEIQMCLCPWISVSWSDPELMSWGSWWNQSSISRWSAQLFWTPLNWISLFLSRTHVNTVDSDMVRLRCLLMKKSMEWGRDKGDNRVICFYLCILSYSCLGSFWGWKMDGQRLEDAVWVPRCPKAN